MAIIVSLDIGTSKLCALALKIEAFEPLAIHSISNGANVANLPEGYYEQDPTHLLVRVFDLLADLLDDKAVRREEIVGLSITGQMHGVLLVDPDLRPTTNLITWRDGRVLQAEKPGCLDEAQHLVGLEAAKRTGCRLHAGYGGATLYHLARNGGLPKDVTAMTIADYIAASLTGVVATEPTLAASWGLLNLQSRQWDAEMVRRLGLPIGILPPIGDISRPLAPVRPNLARSLGLPSNAQMCLPIGDNQASIIGAAGLTRDVAVINLGTGGQVSIPQPEFVLVEGFETRPMPFGGYILVGASLCGGWSYAYLRHFVQDVVRQFAGVELDDKTVYHRMNRLAVDALPGNTGLVVNPYFQGTRADPDVRGTIRGINTENLTAGNLTRAFIEGMVWELAELFQAAKTAGVTRIAASGNAVRENDLVVETIESLIGRKCFVSPHPEEAAFGAAYAAATAICPGAIPFPVARHPAHSVPPLAGAAIGKRHNKQAGKP